MGTEKNLVSNLNVQKVMELCLIMKKGLQVYKVLQAGKDFRGSLVLCPAHSRAKLLRTVSGQVLKHSRDAGKDLS